MFVADTNVISSIDPTKTEKSVHRLDLTADTIFLTTITVAEVRFGILQLRRTGATRKARALSDWRSAVESLYADRILPFDVRAAIVASELADRAAGKGQSPGWPDIQIAAIASLRGYTVLTRNVRHFAPLGVAHRDPFEDPAN